MPQKQTALNCDVGATAEMITMYEENGPPPSRLDWYYLESLCGRNLQIALQSSRASTRTSHDSCKMTTVV